MPSNSQAMPSDSQVHQKRFLNRCRICHGGEVGFQLGGSASQLGERSGQEISWESIAVLLPCSRAAVLPCRRVAASVGLPHGGCHLWPSPVAAMLPGCRAAGPLLGIYLHPSHFTWDVSELVACHIGFRLGITKDSLSSTAPHRSGPHCTDPIYQCFSSICLNLPMLWLLCC